MEAITALAQKRLDWRNTLSAEDRAKVEEDESTWSTPERAEEFNTFIRNLEEAHEHIFFRHVHDIEFILIT